MISFIPIAILAYIFNAGSILIDKILLQKTLNSPIVYTFYISVLQILTIFLIPFGFKFEWSMAVPLAVASGIFNVFALYTFFKSLKLNEASVVGPIVGSLNPFFSLLIGGLLLGQYLTNIQYLAILILIVGSIILTFNMWSSKITLDTKLFWMIASGFLFGVSSVLLKETFMHTTFMNGLIVSRAGSGLFALGALAIPALRTQILSKKQKQKVASRKTLLLISSGQMMGALSSILIIYGIYLANPAIVNSFFGFQYLVILIISLVLAKKHHGLLDENLTRGVIIQKIAGAIVLSVGLYLLSK